MSKRKCLFTEKTRRNYPDFRKGRDDYEAECLVCKPGTFVSVAHKGPGDLEYHMSSDKHKKALKAYKRNKAIRRDNWCAKTDFFVDPDSETEEAVTASDSKLAFRAVMNHDADKSVGDNSDLLRKLFSEAELAQKFPNVQSKREGIQHCMLAQRPVSLDLKALEEHGIPFCGVAIDDSSHRALKMVPVLIQYYDYRNGGLKTKLLELQESPTEMDLSDSLVKALKKHRLLQKCVAFAGDNCNTMFGDIGQEEEARAVFTRLKKSLQRETLIGVHCPAHVLHNCIHHGADALEVDVENIILKIYQYFHIYAVRTEPLQEYCDFVEVEYKQLLSHVRTRWLSLFPGITKLLQMHSALKSFFLGQSNPPAVLKSFFEHEFGELYLWHMHSLMNAFHLHIEEMERENNSLVEVMKTLDSVHTILLDRRAQNFMSLTVKGMLADKRKEGLEAGCDAFSEAVRRLYSHCIDYLEMWMASLQEFSCFTWMALSDTPSWGDVEACISYLRVKGLGIDSRKCFIQFNNLKQFVDASRDDEEFQHLLSHEKWTKYFLNVNGVECYSELLKIVQVFFSIPSCSLNTEHFFCQMELP
ncbi:uncharacterized protein LOC116519975 [Thamnophis elegans]|uniref:uncharacterized protein LOC116519975 n=1 Tax=Thamnophis elegans TaxID=35005 RepID=UPI0013790F98|nr:uncharacterized protein LOC116519975 [Thamnophis elegans]